MSQTIAYQPPADDRAESQWRVLCRVGGLAALAQEVCVIITLIVSFSVGVEPTTAAEYYTMLQDNRLVGLLRLDFPTLILLCLIAFTAFGIYAALRHRAPLMPPWLRRLSIPVRFSHWPTTRPFP